MANAKHFSPFPSCLAALRMALSWRTTPPYSNIFNARAALQIFFLKTPPCNTPNYSTWASGVTFVFGVWGLSKQPGQPTV